jgi:hypothetical protein
MAFTPQIKIVTTTIATGAWISQTVPVYLTQQVTTLAQALQVLAKLISVLADKATFTGEQMEYMVPPPAGTALDFTS